MSKNYSDSDNETNPEMTKIFSVSDNETNPDCEAYYQESISEISKLIEQFLEKHPYSISNRISSFVRKTLPGKLTFFCHSMNTLVEQRKIKGLSITEFLNGECTIITVFNLVQEKRSPVKIEGEIERLHEKMTDLKIREKFLLVEWEKSNN